MEREELISKVTQKFGWGNLILSRLRREGLSDSDLLLGALYEFLEIGRAEVSLAEILETVKLLSTDLGIKFGFEERVLYSSRFFQSLDQLDYQGFVQEIVYRHDHFLPKSYLMLTAVGRGHAKKVFEEIPENIKGVFRKAVELMAKQHGERWKYWARPSR